MLQKSISTAKQIGRFYWNGVLTIHRAHLKSKQIIEGTYKSSCILDQAHLEWTRSQITKCAAFGIYFMFPFSAVFLPVVLKFFPGFVPTPFLLPEQKVG
jgi:hypothetical protein